MVRSAIADIIRFNVETQSIDTIFDGNNYFPQAISVDKENTVIYWVDFKEPSEERVKKTYYSGTTMDLNISYSDNIKISQDMLHLYVLDTANNRIDKYNKSSLERIESITVSADAKYIVIGFGKSFNMWRNNSADRFYIPLFVGVIILY